MKNLTLFFCYFIILSPKILHAQKEANNWYFGKNAGITFNSGTTAALTTGQLNTIEGCATISNDKGRLLFYTDGIKVWDSTHNVTPNGTGLLGHPSSSQSAIIVPRPDSIGQYYIFTVDEMGKGNGLRYSEFKMKLASGNGDVVSSTKNIKLMTVSCEKITAVKKANGKDFWVLALRFGTDTLYAISVTSAGLSSTIVKTNTGFKIPSSSSTDNAIGYLKASPDGTKIAYANFEYDTLAIADFNTTNGRVSNVWRTYLDDGYGVEFSPSSKFLYAAECRKLRIYQFDAKATSKSGFINSKAKVDSITGTSTIGALQLGPDEKIYLSRSTNTYLDVIHAPDSSAKSCRFRKNYVYLSGKTANQGLPTFIQSFFKKNEAQFMRNCINDSTFIWPVVVAGLDSVRWDFGDSASGSANYSKAIKNAWHIYKKTGTYKVKLYSYFKTNNDTSIITVTVKNPKPFIGKDTSYCNLTSRNLLPQKNYIKYKWSNGDSIKTSIIKTKGTYILTATDSTKCVSSDTIMIKNNIANAYFNSSDTSICYKNNSFQFKNKSIFKDDTLKSLIWKLSDNTSYTDSVFKKSFSTADSFMVKLIVTSKNGCKDSFTKKVFVNPNTSIGFIINKTPQCFNGHDFELTNSSTISKGTINYSWNFGDGNTAATKDISSKKYNIDSTYKVTLITITDKGCRDTTSKTITVHPNPKSVYSINQVTQCFTYNSYDFTNSSTIRTGSIASQTWNFGDSKTATSKDVSKKKYTTADSFAVMLLNISDKGCRDSITKKVYVNPNTAIGFSINKTQQCYNGHDFVFTNSSTVSKGTMTYDWNFGDGNTSTTKDISSKKYSIDSTYKVSLVTTTDKGCKDTISKTITLNPNSKSVYSINQVTQCFAYNSYDFTNSSTVRTGNIASQSWNFGDTKTATTKDVSKKKYATADSFSVMLLNISDKGCRDSLTKKVYVNPNTSIGFTINKTPQCFSGHDFVFTNSSSVSKGTITYDWNLGDGNTATTKDISSKKYAIDSTYKVTLITTTDKGCKDTVAKTVVVNPNPKAGFGINQITQCFKWNLYDYTNSSTIRTGSIAATNWQLGDADNRSSNDIKAKHYSTEDSFKVDLLTVSNNACRDSISKWVYLLNSPKPDFAINKDTQCFNGHSFTYQNNTTIAKGTYSSLWQLGDATTNTNTDVSTKQYSVYGNYNILLILTSNNNCKDSIQKNIRINPNAANKFIINTDRQCYRGNNFNFTNQSTIAQGTITYNWNLGDTKTFTTKDVSNYKYATEDSFNVRLITTSDKGCKDTLSKMVVTFAQPIAKFTVPQDSQCWQKHFFIINNATTLKYGTISHVWDFGDGTKDFTYNPSTKTYQNKSANYTLKYKVTSDHGCTDSAQKKISLLERPISTFSINDSIQCFSTNSFSFTNKTTFSDLTTLSYTWNYGDGSKTTGKVPKSLSYPAANYYTVQLIARSYLNNCVDTLNKIMVVAPHATPDYSIDNDSQCLRTNKFTFTNLSKVKFGTLTYNWNFGDNTKDTAANPAKKYNNGSNYSVKLVATTNYNCKDSINKPLVLIPHPKSNFTANDSTLCKVQSLGITNKTTVLYGNFTQVWHFDEGANETTLNINSKKLIASGFHPVRLAVISNFGCTDTILKKVFVEQSATTKISIVENDSQCLRGNKTQFNVFSQGGIINLSSYSWQFGDGSSSTIQNPTHTYNTDSSFKVSAETVSSNGCLDTAYFDMVIHPHPVSDFTATSPCFPNPVFFTNTSKIKKGSIVSQNWDLDGSTSTLLNPTTAYTSAGTYTIKLKNKSNYGCTDSITKQAIVKAKPSAMFSYSQLPSADEIKLQLNNQSSTDVITNNWDFGDGTLSQEVNPIASYKDTGRYNIILEVINSDGCKDTFKVKTDLFYPDFVIYLPTVFSPNGNGVNDVFRPLGSQYNRIYTMEIYNRWGEKIFETHDVSEGWDGKYKGQDCQDGIYHCYVRILPIKGPLKSYYSGITLLR